ncbi:hypothetical protein [Neoaquamicrobium sediminum]|uniref:hypothetical protein n=1 Tax=Neoaquamicrobium sediminum TaxID=1849104 RepID=UPI0015655124|nr:hypothetical protein [Mesorhizobium sediminum]NRC57233.1 hypothetical protein [Mesorhizobium sediminum]
MARDTTTYSLAHVATMIGENRELLEVVAANPDDIDYGEMIYIIDGTEDGITAFTARGIESLQEFLQDVRSWPGGIRQFLIDQECNPDMIDRIIADEPKS